MSYSLNPLKGVIQGIIHGSVIGLIKGDTRSLDYGSYKDIGIMEKQMETTDCIGITVLGSTGMRRCL